MLGFCKVLLTVNKQFTNIQQDNRISDIEYNI